MKIVKIRQDGKLASLLKIWHDAFEQKKMHEQAAIFGTMHIVFATGSSTNTRDLQVLKNNIEIRKNTFIQYPQTKADNMPTPSPATNNYMQQVIYEANTMLKLIEKQKL